MNGIFYAGGKRLWATTPEVNVEEVALRTIAHTCFMPDTAWRGRLVATVHDEIVAECPAEEATQTAAWLQRHMTAAMTKIVDETVPVEVETTSGRDWAGNTK